MLLSDMGAEVVKVEQPGVGDYMRATPPTLRGRSPVHDIINRNKLSIGVDLKRSEGREVLTRLLKRADVFLEGFRPGVMARLGFSFSKVRELKEKIAYCSISSYGQKSRLSTMPGHDLNFEAMAGTLSYLRRPTIPQSQPADVAAGLYAAVCVLGALAGGRRGVYIDIPIVQTILATLVVPASSFFVTGKDPREGSSMLFGSAPYYSIYRTSDGGYMAVAAIEEQFWKNLTKELGVPEIEGLRFGTPAERRKVRNELAKAFASRTRDEWASVLMFKDTCATPVLELSEALASEWSGIQKAGLSLPPPMRSLPSARSAPPTRAPELGEHTRRLMKELGYKISEVRRLQETGAIQ